MTHSLPTDHESAVQNSIAYLADQSIEANPYWPKWNSAWWHMSVLFEMGLAHRIPKPTAEKMLAAVKRTYLPYFFQKDAPASQTLHQDAPCPCALGNIYQILTAAGLDVDSELPWAREWFLTYQMPDGGLNCDEHAYQADPNASSIVGTIAPLEAILLSSRGLTSKEILFVDRGAKCLLHRELRLGSSSQHNAEEREDEADWIKPCFPRFYLYDVLRGLNFVLRWADLRNQVISKSSIAHVVQHLDTRYPSGQICIERHSFQDVSTRTQTERGNWDRHQRKPANHFPLLDQVSKIGADSPYLTGRWQEAKSLMADLQGRGLLK